MPTWASRCRGIGPTFYSLGRITGGAHPQGDPEGPAGLAALAAALALAVARDLVPAAGAARPRVGLAVSAADAPVAAAAVVPVAAAAASVAAALAAVAAPAVAAAAGDNRLATKGKGRRIIVIVHNYASASYFLFDIMSGLWSCRPVGAPSRPAGASSPPADPCRRPCRPCHFH